jgi:hypothetical protein
VTAHISPKYSERLSRFMETTLPNAFDGLLVVGDAVVRSFKTCGRLGHLESARPACGSDARGTATAFGRADNRHGPDIMAGYARRTPWTAQDRP